MSYKRCPNCGNDEDGDYIARCNNCHKIFCINCLVQESKFFFGTKKSCPHCGAESEYDIIDHIDSDSDDDE